MVGLSNRAVMGLEYGSSGTFVESGVPGNSGATRSAWRRYRPTPNRTQKSSSRRSCWKQQVQYALRVPWAECVHHSLRVDVVNRPASSSHQHKVQEQHRRSAIYHLDRTITGESERCARR